VAPSTRAVWLFVNYRAQRQLDKALFQARGVRKLARNTRRSAACRRCSQGCASSIRCSRSRLSPTGIVASELEKLGHQLPMRGGYRGADGGDLLRSAGKDDSRRRRRSPLQPQAEPLGGEQSRSRRRRTVAQRIPL
jgi:hypothetical protein